MLQPTVGRQVHFYTPAGTGPFAATIFAVLGPDRVNLDVIDENGQHYVERNVLLCDGQYNSDCCCWPPIGKLPIQESAEKGFADRGYKEGQA